ncbi:Rad52/Rad22 family DNA repair protein [Microvirga calopogonii]|uniref:Rad52/Rad22 family DNA repair protein n=1 Tax=Microvirga calopogonii TaxID=2078013 RepID=UPI000E0DAAF7|nr:Rad52/Rad22 family DNA repair protein [Microvirga calopogonii]
MPARTNPDVVIALKEKVANENKKDRQGDNRSKLYYVKMEYDATKLDEIFGPENWRTEILNQESRVWEQDLVSFKQNKQEVYKARVASAWMTVRLTVKFPDGRETFRDGVGAGDAIRRADNPNSVEAEGLALKAAGTDAIKRAATLLGNIFGRGMEKDGTQRYDYDYVPPEDDEADDETRPTSDVAIANDAGQPQGEAQPTQVQPQSRPPSPPQASAHPTAQTRPASSPQTRSQPQQPARPQQYQEPNVTSGLARPPQGQAPASPTSQARTEPEVRPRVADEFESALNGAQADVRTLTDPLSEHLRLIIPQGKLIEVGHPDRWKNIFSQLNEARKNWVTTVDQVEVMKAHMADFRSRASNENIISGSSAGAKDIKHYFDTMDTFIDRRRQQILGLDQAA